VVVVSRVKALNVVALPSCDKVNYTFSVRYHSVLLYTETFLSAASLSPIGHQSAMCPEAAHGLLSQSVIPGF